MEVWVVGATGLLGRRVVPALLRGGHRVVGLARSPQKWPDPPAEMEFIPLDVTSPGQSVRVFSGRKPDVVVNLATALPNEKPTREDIARNDAVRVEGTRNMTEQAILTESYYVHGSTILVCESSGDAWVTEETHVGHQQMTNSAIESEGIVRKAFLQGLQGCVLRGGTAYAADSGQTRALLHAIRTGSPSIIGAGQNWWSLITPEDYATAVALAAEVQPEHLTLTVVDDEPVHVGDLVRWLAGATHSKPPRSVSPLLARLGLGSGTVDILTGSRRGSNAAAKAALGWLPASPSYRNGFPAALKQIGYTVSS